MRAFLSLSVSSMLLVGSNGYTDPDELRRLLVLRDSLRRRGTGWAKAVETWTCPGETGGGVQVSTEGEGQEDPQTIVLPGFPSFGGFFGGRRRLSAVEDCDPCGNDAKGWGNWKHLGCRGGPNGEYVGERSVLGMDAPAGFVTNVHITDQSMVTPGGLNSEIPPEFCLLKELREFDLDGASLFGPISSWIPSCFPFLRELDLSYNQLSGNIPNWFVQMEGIQEYKVEFNNLTGRIPEGFASLSNIRIIRVDENQLQGPLPQDFKYLDTIQSLWLQDNPGLCGPLQVPEIELVCCFCEVAECGLYTDNTRIGRPCRGDWPPLDPNAIDLAQPLVTCSVPTEDGQILSESLPQSACLLLDNLYA